MRALGSPNEVRALLARSASRTERTLEEQRSGRAGRHKAEAPSAHGVVSQQCQTLFRFQRWAVGTRRWITEGHGTRIGTGVRTLSAGGVYMRVGSNHLPWPRIFFFGVAISERSAISVKTLFQKKMGGFDHFVAGI